jgi:hypothetical protein
MGKIKLLVLIFLVSCSPEPMVKPFIIVNKEIGGIGGYGKPTMSRYIYQDKNGFKQEFVDSTIRYNIGDTLN